MEDTLPPAQNADEAAFRNILAQQDTFGKCIDISAHASPSQKEQALKKALGYVKYYDEAVYINMASNDQELRKQAIAKAISIACDPLSLEFWITRAPTDELKANAEAKLKELKKGGQNGKK
jgi:hypothetical protein